MVVSVYSSCFDCCGRIDLDSMKTLSTYAYGTLLMIIGVLVLSPDSGVLRLIDGDPFVISFWRGLGVCVVIWCFAILRSPKDFAAQLTTPSWLSLGILLSFGLSSMAFVFGVTYLGAPTMLVFIAMTPLASAMASWVMEIRSSFCSFLFRVSIAIVSGSAAHFSSTNLVSQALLHRTIFPFTLRQHYRIRVEMMIS